MFRTQLDPSLPSNHPINALSPLRKHLILYTLAYAGLLANFGVAILQCAFVPMGKAFGVSPGDIPNSIGYQLLGFAVGPLLWAPLAQTIGRRPVYLIGAFLYMPCCVWMALSNSYAVFCVARTVAGIVSSWSQVVPPASVADIFVKEVRGSKMSVYSTCVVIAPAVAPVFSGLIINSYSWRVQFWLVLALAGLQFILFFFIVPETLWVADAAATPPTSADRKPKAIERTASDLKPIGDEEQIEMSPGPLEHSQASRRVGSAWMPWTRPREYFALVAAPIAMARFLPVLLPSIYYGSLFAWSVGITIVMPQKFEEPPYNFATIPLGCAFLAFGIGGVLGKWSGGIVGDLVVSRFERKKGQRQPEHRLWALLPLLPFMFVGCAIVGVTIEKELHWIAYLIGGGLFFFCLSAATGILQTYVLESYLPRAQDTQAVFIFFKSIWGFVIPQFVTEWGESDGYLAEYLAQGALATGVGAVLCGGLIWKGYELRRAQRMPVVEK